MVSTFPMFLAVYALLYAAFGVQSPFLPTLLRERGLHAQEIGILLAASTAIAGLGYLSMLGFGELMLVAVFHAAMLAPIVPISDALATTAARQSKVGDNRRFEYGWLRASGSAAFVVDTLLSGGEQIRLGWRV